jgi:hypothetical protein
VPDTRSGRKGAPYKVVPAARSEPGGTLERGHVGVKPSAHRFSGGWLSVARCYEFAEHFRALCTSGGCRQQNLVGK